MTKSRASATRATSDAVDARMEAIPSEFPRLEVRVDRRDARDDDDDDFGSRRVELEGGGSWDGRVRVR